MIPVTISCCHTFMLPIGTPCNAMVVSAAKMRPGEMVDYFLEIFLKRSGFDDFLLADESWSGSEYWRNSGFVRRYGDDW